MTNVPTGTCVPGIGDCSLTAVGNVVAGVLGSVVEVEVLETVLEVDEDELLDTAVVEVVGGAIVVEVVEVVVVVGDAVHVPFSPKEAITDAAWFGDSPRRSGTRTVFGKVSDPFAIVTETDAPFKSWLPGGGLSAIAYPGGYSPEGAKEVEIFSP